MGITVKNETEYDEPKAFDLIPAGVILETKISELREQPISWTDKATDEPRTAVLIKWRFDVTEGEYAGRWVWGSVDSQMNASNRNRFRLWAETALGREILPGETFDTDELLGLPVKVAIRHRADKKDPSKVYVEVDDLLPVSGGFSFDDGPPF